MPNNEIDFITKFYGIVINGVPGSVHYNGTRHFVGKKEIEKLKPFFTSLEKVIENITPKIEEKKTQEKIGGLLPLVALLPLIFGGITAAAATTGGIANAIAKSDENKEQVRHNAEMEKIAKEGQGFNDSDEELEELKYCVEKLKGAGAGFSFV